MFEDKSEDHFQIHRKMVRTKIRYVVKWYGNHFRSYLELIDLYGFTFLWLHSEQGRDGYPGYIKLNDYLEPEESAQNARSSSVYKDNTVQQGHGNKSFDIDKCINCAYI